jgi:4-amino-4-deoxy-L-arabinose transferase-like glycosyltransferase
MNNPGKQTLIHICLLFIVSAIVFGFKAGDQDFWGRHGEARRAEVAREMVVSGDWIVPHLNGEPFVTKPPLYYWAAALTFTLTGKFDELSARIPSIISGIVGVFITYLWASCLFSRQVGLFAGIILATSFLYGGMARTAGVDMMLTMFTTAALCCFTIGLEGQNKFCTPKLHTLMYLLTAVWIGFGTMAKNPIGLAVPLLAIAGFILVARNFKLILDTKPWWGLLIFLIIVLPWLILVYQHVPNFFEVLRQETLARYTDPEEAPHLEPFYYYIPALVAFAPWVTFLPGVIISLFSRKTQRLLQSHRFLIIAALTTFLLFSSVGSKREYYLLPLYPILAVLVAKCWDEYVSMKHTNVKRWTWKSMDIPIVGFAGLLCIAGFGVPIVATLYLPQYIFSSLGFGIVFVCLGIALLVIFLRDQAVWTFGVYSTATIWLYLFVLMVIVPEMNNYRSRKGFFHEAARIVGEQPIVDYNYEGFEAQFYLQRTFPVLKEVSKLQQLLTSGVQTFVIVNDRHYDQLQREYPELLKKFQVVLDRVWTSAMDPKRQQRLLLLKT